MPKQVSRWQSDYDTSTFDTAKEAVMHDLAKLLAATGKVNSDQARQLVAALVADYDQLEKCFEQLHELADIVEPVEALPLLHSTV